MTAISRRPIRRASTLAAVFLYSVPCLGFGPLPLPVMRQAATAHENPEGFLASFLRGDGLEASLRALRDDEARSCIRTENVLSRNEMMALRDYCDKNVFYASPTGDDVVVLNDITGARKDLESILCCDATVQKLRALPQLLDGMGDEEMEVASVLMRRYRGSSQNPAAFPWHTDDHSATVNIALSSPIDYTGGDLVAIYGGECRRHHSRIEGDTIVHLGSVAHAVEPVLSGCRYAMVIFFDGRQKREEQLARSASDAAAGAEHQYQPNAQTPGLYRPKKKRKPVKVAWATESGA